jgi:hypothetical protein
VKNPQKIIIVTMKTISLSFDFQGAPYEALARVKETTATTEYHITVMNGELEKRLFGNHIIIEEEKGNLRIGPVSDDSIASLKCCIGEALKKELQAPIATE